MSFVDAVQSNDRRDALLALRDKIAATIDGTDSGRDIAALSKRLMEVMREIDALPDPEAGRARSTRRRGSGAVSSGNDLTEPN